jgi:hypothetical protein
MAREMSAKVAGDATGRLVAPEPQTKAPKDTRC